MQTMISLRDVSYSFGSKKVLNKLNIDIKAGSFHTLLGISGAGKTLTLRLIASLMPLTSGELQGLPQKINYAFQMSPLIPWLTVKKNLEICTGDFQELENYLDRLELKNLSELYPDQLSGGMIQKINILRSFLGRPDLILMDEPFVHIDSIQKEDLHKFLTRLWETSHPTIIFVTHDIDEALYLSQYISLYSSKTGNITRTLDVSGISSASILELKNSAHYSENFAKIYNFLKQEKEI